MTQSKALPTAYRSCPVGELEEIERINVGEVLFDRTGKPCPLCVISGHRIRSASCPLYPQKRTFVETSSLCRSSKTCRASQKLLPGSGYSKLPNGPENRGGAQMASYLLIESRDPYDSNDVWFCCDLARQLAEQGD